MAVLEPPPLELTHLERALAHRLQLGNLPLARAAQLLLLGVQPARLLERREPRRRLRELGAAAARRVERRERALGPQFAQRAQLVAGAAAELEHAHCAVARGAVDRRGDSALIMAAISNLPKTAEVGA